MSSTDTMEDDGSKPSSSTRKRPSGARSKTVSLSEIEAKVHLGNQTLREQFATRVLRLFSISLLGTLSFAGVLVLIDAAFIATKIIAPEQRLVTEKILMTFVTATVLQVGAAVAAIVYAVFNDARARERTQQLPQEMEGNDG